MNHPIFSKLLWVATGTILSILSPQTSAGAATFNGLGDLPGGIFLSGGITISNDASAVAVAGTSLSADGPTGEAFRWTEATGIVGLGDLPGGNFFSAAFGISADGSIVVGASISAASASAQPPQSQTEAFRWTAETGIVGLGDLEGGEFSSFGFKISGDGSVIVGDSDSTLGRQAFRWTAETEMQALGDLEGGEFSSVASSVSADGAVIVGSGTQDLGTEAFRWTEQTGLVGLGDLQGGNFFSRASDVSSDGLVVVGRSASTNSSLEGFPITDQRGTEAFRWTVETGMVGLGDLPGGNFFSRAFAVSGDGSIVIGLSESELGQEAFIWDNINGMRSLTDVLTNEFSLDLSDWTNLVARDISDDGLSITGFGVNPDGRTEAWVVSLATEPTPVPEPTFGWGLLALVTLLRKISCKLPNANAKLLAWALSLI